MNMFVDTLGKVRLQDLFAKRIMRYADKTVSRKECPQEQTLSSEVATTQLAAGKELV